MATPLENPAQILVIDDSDAEVTLLRAALTEHGEPYELTVLPDGEAALRFIVDHRAGIRQPEPCVIMLDLNLPRHDGLAVMKALKTEPVLSHIKVLLVSNFPAPKTQALIREMGVIYQDKPSDWTGYLDLAAQLLAMCKEGSLSDSMPPIGTLGGPKENPRTRRAGCSDRAGFVAGFDFWYPPLKKTPARPGSVAAHQTEPLP
jgi:CheY-like chemotaxis protein